MAESPTPAVERANADDLSPDDQADHLRDRLIEILENTSDFVSTATVADGRVTYLNRAGRRLVGWAPDEPLAGRHIRDLHPAWALDRIEREALPVAAIAGQWNGETALLHRDGREIPVSQVVLAHRRPDGSVDLYSTIMRDLTDRSHVESELRQRERLQRTHSQSLLALMMSGRVFEGDFPKAVAQITEVAGALLDVGRCSVWHYADEYRTIRCLDVYELDRRAHSGGEVLQAADFPAYADSHRRGEIVAAADVFTDPRTREIPEAYYRAHDIRSLLDVPIWLGNRVGGLLSFEATGRRREWTPDDERLASDMSTLVTLAFESAERKRAEAVRELDRSRLETLVALSQMTESSLDEIAAFALEQAVRLTQSDLGYVAFANEDERVLTMHAWSSAAMRQCRTREFQREYVVADTGLWGEPVRQRRPVVTNDYAAPSPLKKGTPEGHVVVRRHLGVPVFDGDRIVIVAGVGNKADEYDEVDVRQLTLLMGGMWQILKRQRADEEKLRLQAQLAQAQRMESIGRLAGGVAHDFNNMLQAILGNAALALADAPPGSPLSDNLEEIRKSAERSANLTRQLLAFARRQTIRPQPLDLNEQIAGVIQMLRRLIGEHIDLVWRPGTALWPVRMDPGQVDQILTNLTLNARDAIADAGTITVETANVTPDATAPGSPPAPEGNGWVALTVRDTGRGFDDEARLHVFEPFYTTKPEGRGTGLGLATVFGIVEQNEGQIDVESAPGQGTTIRIRLPRSQAPVETVAPAAPDPGRADGTDTLLLVEDEPQVLELARRLLQQRGYTILAAPTPDVALDLAARHGGPIHLLVTDVVMPGMNGRELRDRLRISRPGVACLFMSGYTADVIADHGVLEPGVDYLQKPFTGDALVGTVRRILDRPARR